MATVILTQNRDDIGGAIIEALDNLPLERLVRGRSVAVKPNETCASADDTSGVTQADTLRAVLKAVRAFEPRELIVSGGAGAAETEDVFRYAGLLEVIEEARAEFVDHNRGPFTGVELEYAPSREGESHLSRMSFPAMSLDDAIGTFTEIVYGKRLTFQHA